MNEEEFEKNVVEIKEHLKAIRKQTKIPVWRSFVNGTLSGLGSVIGVAIALTLLGWFLNSIGVIPAFKRQATELRQTLDNLRQNK